MSRIDQLNAKFESSDDSKITFPALELPSNYMRDFEAADASSKSFNPNGPFIPFNDLLRKLLNSKLYGFHTGYTIFGKKLLNPDPFNKYKKLIKNIDKNGTKLFYQKDSGPTKTPDITQIIEYKLSDCTLYSIKSISQILLLSTKPDFTLDAKLSK